MLKYDLVDNPHMALVETAGEVMALYWYQRATAAEDALRRLSRQALADEGQPERPARYRVERRNGD